jgi:hypothetical protein
MVPHRPFRSSIQEEAALKKLILVLIVAVLALSAVVTPALAVPTAELNALAEYYPADTVVFASGRIDDGYVETLDGLIQRIAAAIPDSGTAPTIADGLNELVDQALGQGDFQSEVRPWLGQVASLGILSLDRLFGRGPRADGTPSLLIAVEITDRAGAETFFKEGFEHNNVEPDTRTEGGYTILEADEMDDAFVAIGDAVMFVATEYEILPLEAPAESLAANSTFADTIGLLPAGDYNISIFANLGETLGQMMEMQGMEDMPGMGALLPILENYPPFAVGLTILDARSLTIDMVMPYSAMMAQMAEMGYSTDMPRPVNPAFADRIPAGMPLVIHGTGLATQYRNQIANLKLQAEAMGESDMEVFGYGLEQIEKMEEQITFFVQGLTGLDFEDEVLPAIDGDFALYMGPKASLADAKDMRDLLGELPLDFGLVLEVSDPDVSAALVKGITNAVGMADEVTTSTETIGGTEALVITVPPSRDLPFPIEIIVAGNDDVFFIGTRDAARASLNPDGGLPSDPFYQEASAYLLDQPSYVLYLAGDGLLPLVNVVEMQGGRSGRRDAAQLEAVLKLVSSASITASSQGDVGLIRAVLTLPEG